MSMLDSRDDDCITGIFDTEATSVVVTEKAKKTLIPIGEKSKKLFSIPMGDTAAATDKMNMDHKMRDTATEINVVPEVQFTLVSGSKMANGGHVTMLDKKMSKSMTLTPPKYQMIENQYSKDANARKLDSGAFHSHKKSEMRILTPS